MFEKKLMEDLGVRVHYKQQLGRDFTVTDLKVAFAGGSGVCVCVCVCVCVSVCL